MFLVLSHQRYRKCEEKLAYQIEKFRFLQPTNLIIDSM